MALTILEFAKTQNDLLTRGFVEVLSRKSPILQYLPFQSINASAISFNREATLPDVQYRAVNEDWDESSGTLDKITESLSLFGGVVDTDVFFSKVGQDINDVRAMQSSMKAKSMALDFNDGFVKGDVSSAPKSWDGLQSRIGTGQQLLENGTTNGGDALSLTNLTTLIDMVVDSDPDLLIMNKTMARRLSVAARLNTVGGWVTFTIDEFGRRVQRFDEIPLGIMRTDAAGDDILAFDEVGGGGATATATSIYAVKFGMEYCHGIQASPIQVEDLGRYSGGNKYRTAVEWYVNGCVVGNPTSIARLRGISDAAVVA